MEKASTTGAANQGNTETFETDTVPNAAISVAKGLQSYLHTGNLSAEVKITDDNGVGETLTVRDYIRAAFADLGIEIAFSGKNEFEKGVIIDMDETKIAELGLSADALRFGQTVVKVNPAYYR